jgi:hypothetical protein
MSPDFHLPNEDSRRIEHSELRSPQSWITQFPFHIHSITCSRICMGKYFLLHLRDS